MSTQTKLAFGEFRTLMLSAFEHLLELSNGNLFYREIDRDHIWSLYLDGFTEADGERQEHNCNACKSFLRQYGGLFAIIDNKMVTIWDELVSFGDGIGQYWPSIESINHYIHRKQDKLSGMVAVLNLFVTDTLKLGTKQNYDSSATGPCVTWEHLYLELPKNYRFHTKMKDVETIRAGVRESKNVFQRALEEFQVEQLEEVLTLANKRTIYVGASNLPEQIAAFLPFLKEYKAIEDKRERELYCWSKAAFVHQGITRLRNTSVGTLLVDLAEGRPMEEAVKSFESKIGGANYKRPTALVTERQIVAAKAKLQELGLIDSLNRRFATEADLTINDVLFTDRTRGNVDAFQEMLGDTKVDTAHLKNYAECSIETFINEVLKDKDKPVNSIEALVENKHTGNFLTLVAPVDPNSKSLFQWNNGYSWSYTGGVTDVSIQNRVKKAGGNLVGALRASLAWSNTDDLDLHVHEPNGNVIYYGNRRNVRGFLDVDANAYDLSTEPVENITFDKKTMLEGEYTIKVNQFCKRQTTNMGFTLQIECQGKIQEFHFDRNPAQSETVTVVKLYYTYKDGMVIQSSGSPGRKPTIPSLKKWGIDTQRFHRVVKMMYSPNFWESGNHRGNKHFIFMLDKCEADEMPRPFFNEFLMPELHEHRQVLEVLGSKVRTEEAHSQLSGIGFSETIDNAVFLRVNQNKVYKVLINAPVANPAE